MGQRGNKFETVLKDPREKILQSRWVLDSESWPMWSTDSTCTFTTELQLLLERVTLSLGLLLEWQVSRSWVWVWNCKRRMCLCYGWWWSHLFSCLVSYERPQGHSTVSVAPEFLGWAHFTKFPKVVFTQQVFIKCLPCVRHCTGFPWGDTDTGQVASVEGRLWEHPQGSQMCLWESVISSYMVK